MLPDHAVTFWLFYRHPGSKVYASLGKTVSALFRGDEVAAAVTELVNCSGSQLRSGDYIAQHPNGAYCIRVEEVPQPRFAARVVG